MKEMWIYIAVVLCIAFVTCLIIQVSYLRLRDSARRERDHEQREAEIDREMEDWRRQQREAFHFDAQKFVDSFVARNGTVAPTCPICGGHEYYVHRNMAMIRHRQGMEDATGSVIPCATIMCKSCSRLQFFALGRKYADINKKTWLCDEEEEEHENGSE